ncbi:MAG: cytochrome c oxidase subunit II [Chloroflexota bacterium]|nr:MAG: cytochrome c oxidase subunit II [Chloroflexota bacterium]
MGELPIFPVQASTIASQVDLLLLVLVLLSGFFTSIVVALIFYFGIRYHRGNQIDRSNPPWTNLKIEVGWVFGLLVLGMSTFTGAAIIYNNITQPPQDALEIYVVGQQWMWKFQHPEGPQEINTLHVPRGRDVRLIMTSEDVIHSLFVPAFRLKYDVIPGRYTSFWFNATRAGEYHLFCTEYCGTLHSGMVGSVIVMEPVEYQEWLGSGGEDSSTTGSGQTLFTQLGCSSCHVTGSGERAPSLEAIFGQQAPLESGESVTVDENYLRESILFPMEKIVAGYEPIMPSYEGRVTEEQLIELVAYIKSLSGPGAQETSP